MDLQSATAQACIGQVRWLVEPPGTSGWLRIIVNCSPKDYGEYANSNNFGYELAQQVLWITHPRHGITFSMPVNLDEDEQGVKLGARGVGSWVPFHDAKRIAYA